MPDNRQVCAKCGDVYGEEWCLTCSCQNSENKESIKMSDIYDGKELKDSGERQSFGTGAVRDTQTNKGRYDLLPPSAIFAIARVFEEGSKKYGARNFEQGIPLSRYLDSALRHLFKHLEGHRDEAHIVQAGWNILAYIFTATQIQRGILPESLNDLPNHLGKEKPTVL